MKQREGQPLSELETSLQKLGDLWSAPSFETFVRFVDVAASAMLANVGLKRDDYRAKFVAYPEAVQAHLDATFKHLVDAMNAQTYVDLLGELYAERAA